MKAKKNTQEPMLIINSRISNKIDLTFCATREDGQAPFRLKWIKRVTVAPGCQIQIPKSLYDGWHTLDIQYKGVARPDGWKPTSIKVYKE